MSNAAIKWALSQPLSKSSAKFVLVVMADLAGDDDMKCFPSSKHLSDATGQDVKTVLSGLRLLREDGFISDTGERRGATGQVVVYQLNTTKTGCVGGSKTPPNFQPNTPEKGVVDDDGNTPVFPSNTPVFPIKHTRFSHQTHPKTVDGHLKDTSRTPITHKKDVDRVDLLEGVPAELVVDYLAVRKSKRAGPLTKTAVDGLKRETEKAGITLQQAIQACCEFSWQGFNAGWYAQRTGVVTGSGKNSSHRGLSNKSYSEGVNADGTFV